MTPALFDLPLSLGDAARLAAVLLDVIGSSPKPVTDDQRSRVAARLSAVSFQEMEPCYASLERDPVHPAACYICVDGVEGQPLLLRAAPATTPSSGLFPKSILIGRTHSGHRELVLNAIPFGPADRERIAAFAEQVNKAYQPRPAGSRPVIVVRSLQPEDQFPHAFTAFRRILKTTGQNQAAFGLADEQDPADFCFSAIQAAIRSGWREGFSLHGPPGVAIPGLKRRPFESVPDSAVRIVDLPAGYNGEDL